MKDHSPINQDRNDEKNLMRLKHFYISIINKK